MSYVATMLAENERVLYGTREHWVTLASPLLLLAAGAALASYLQAHVTSSAAAWLAVVPGLVSLFVDILRRTLEEHVVTTFRVISRVGIVRRDVFAYPLESINTVEVHQGLIGRLLGYGTVEVHSQAETHGTTGRACIRDPEQWRAHIFEAMRLLRGENSIGTAPRQGGRVEVADRLRQLTELHQQGFLTEQEFQQRRQGLIDSI